MSGPGERPRLLLVGGGGGLVGRAVLEEFRSDWAIRSVHRHVVAAEASAGVEWVAGDVSQIADWRPLLDGVELVVNLAWYRSGPERRFRDLATGLVGLVAACEAARTPRMVQLSVPAAPAALEAGLPYLRWKRAIDLALTTSRVPHSVVRSSMVFGPRDKLLTVMLRTMARYHRFPMFGDGEYHVSPIASHDLARILRREASLPESRTVDAGGPTRWRYRDLTDRMFAALGRRPRYVRFSPRGAVRLARFLETLGSSLLYAYEVEWLLADLLGTPAYPGLDPPLAAVEPFLDSEALRYR
jgi:uncharacterized protein YbjT (DUF2867 family)